MWNYMHAAPWLINDREFEDSERDSGSYWEDCYTIIELINHTIMIVSSVKVCILLLIWDALHPRPYRSNIVAKLR